MEYKSCAFIGHREIDFTDKLKSEIKTELIHLIENENYGVFKFGGLGEFDYYCYETVTELKEKYPFIKTVLCLWDGKRPWWAKARTYDEVEICMLSYDYWYSRLYYRNAAMIDSSDFCIFYVLKTENSGAYKAMQYAEKSKKPFINFGVVEE